MAGKVKFGRITVTRGRVEHPDGKGPLAGARATVDTAGGFDRRLSASRVIMTGGLGLFWKKKVDNRELYVLVEGQGFSVVEKVDPKKGAEARKFAGQLNSMAAALVPVGGAPSGPLSSGPPAWGPDPFRRHEARWWDGAKWTDLVMTGGKQGQDPMT